MLENNFFANPQKVNVIQQKIIHQKSGLPKIEITNKEVKFSWQEIHALQKYFALREVLDVFQRAYQIPSPEQQALLLREIREPWRQNVAFTISKKHSEMEEGKQILQQLQKTVKNFWNDKLWLQKRLWSLGEIDWKNLEQVRQLQNRLSNLIGFSAEEKTLFFAGENVGEHFEQNKFYLTKDQFEIVQKNANAQIMELTKETYQKISEIMYIGNDPDAISIYPHLIHDLNKKFEQEKNSIQEKVQEAKSYIVSEDFFDFNALNSLNSVLRAKKQQLSALQEIWEDFDRQWEPELIFVVLERLIKKLSAEIEKLEKKSTALQEELWQGLKKRLPEKYDLQRIVLSQIAEFKKANLDPCLEQIIKNYKNNDFNDKVTSIFEKLKEALAQKFVSKLNFKNQIYEFTSKHLAPLWKYLQQNSNKEDFENVIRQKFENLPQILEKILLPPRSFQGKISQFKAEIFDPLIQYLIENRHQVDFAKKTLNRIETILVQYRLNLLLQILEKKSVEMAQDLEKGTKQIEDVWSFLTSLVETNLFTLEDLKSLLDETSLKKTVLEKLAVSAESLSEAEFDSAMERLFVQTKSIREKMNGLDVKKLAKFGSFAALPQDFFKIDDAIDEMQTEIVHTQWILNKQAREEEKKLKNKMKEQLDNIKKE